MMLNGNRYTKRCHRWDFAGQAHELTFNCYLNRSFLSKERTRQFLVHSINAARRRCEFDLWAYVFMPNHVHLVICPKRETYSISDILLSIKQPVSRKAILYLKEHNPAGLRLLATGQRARSYHFWQKGGGYDRNITQVDTLIETVRYIHNNPVRKGLVQTPSEWYYSSAADWESGKPGPLSIDHDSFPAH
jgi:putative transposase